MTLDEHLVTLDAHLGELNQRFYATLFERHPSVRPLFGIASRAVQKQMLMEILSTIAQLDQPWVRDELGTLAFRHQGDFGVSAEMYRWVNDALLDSVAAVSPDWSPSLEAAWKERLDQINAIAIAHAGDPT